MSFSFPERSIIKSKGSKFRINEGTCALWSWAGSTSWEGSWSPPPTSAKPTEAGLLHYPGFTAGMVVVQVVVETGVTNAPSSVMALLWHSGPPSIFCPPSTTIHQLPHNSPLAPSTWQALSSPSPSESVNISVQRLKLGRCSPLVSLRSVLWVAINYFLKIKQKVT